MATQEQQKQESTGACKNTETSQNEKPASVPSPTDRDCHEDKTVMATQEQQKQESTGACKNTETSQNEKPATVSSRWECFRNGVNRCKNSLSKIAPKFVNNSKDGVQDGR
ncbi:uncharacterized protein [Argopecten irradians]|uniref:uncharacterized protein n=1 Tax=Argopecten irradians TaxID=31199 RepID=UPI00371956A0